MGMGFHNKFLLLFDKEEMFWLEFTAQLNTYLSVKDPDYQFLNYCAYGKPGLVSAHIF